MECAKVNYYHKVKQNGIREREHECPSTLFWVDALVVDNGVPLLFPVSAILFTSNMRYDARRQNVLLLLTDDFALRFHWDGPLEFVPNFRTIEIAFRMPLLMHVCPDCDIFFVHTFLISRTQFNSIFLFSSSLFSSLFNLQVSYVRSLHMFAGIYATPVQPTHKQAKPIR